MVDIFQVSIINDLLTSDGELACGGNREQGGRIRSWPETGNPGFQNVFYLTTDPYSREFEIERVT